MCLVRLYICYTLIVTFANVNHGTKSSSSFDGTAILSTVIPTSNGTTDSTTASTGQAINAMRASRDSRNNVKINTTKSTLPMKNSGCPVLLEAPVLEHISNNSITIRVANLTYSPDDAKPQKYIIQYKKKGHEKNFIVSGTYENPDDVFNKTFTIEATFTRKFRYKIRLLLCDPHNNPDEKTVPELITYKTSLNFSHITNSSFSLSWHHPLKQNKEYEYNFTCAQEFFKYSEKPQQKELCKSTCNITQLKPSTNCSIRIYIRPIKTKWQLYDEANVITQAATTIDENEMPENITYANDQIKIVFKNCTEFNGHIKYNFTYRCISSWCNDTANDSFVHHMETYEKTILKNITLQAFATYNITVTASRNKNTFSRVYTLVTPPTEPHQVRNLRINCRTDQDVWLQWVVPSPPTGKVSIYLITTNEHIQLNETSDCKSKVHLIDNITSIVVRAKNEGVEKLGTPQSVEVSSVPDATEAIQNFTVVPSSEEISLQWTNLYLNDLSVNDPNRTHTLKNCTQNCTYKIPTHHESNFTVTVSTLNCESKEVNIEIVNMSAPANLSKNPIVEVCSKLNCNLYIPKPDDTPLSKKFNLVVIKINSTNPQWTVEDLNPENNYITVEIGPDKAVSLTNTSYAMYLKDLVNNKWYPLILPDEPDPGFIKELPIICLLIMIIITVTCLTYLVFAYNLKKYPFDLRNVETSTRRRILSKEQINQPSEHYRSTGVKTIRKKAEPPAKKSELEVLIEPSTSKSEKKATAQVTSIEVKNFEDYLMTALQDDPYSNDLTKQYRKLQKDNIKKRTVGLQEKNVSKNRYKNLIAYDDTRVILKNNGDSDYINANYVDGYENAKAFIATQAPMKSTLSDFWCMIWQEKVSYIIMLTELVENGTVKCEQYWPDLHQKARFGEILITNVLIKVFSDYVVRDFHVVCGSESRMVHHLQYTTWPDHGVPTYPQNFTPFVKRLLAMPQKDSPIVVHCNAGCGRTGTLILCDIILRMAAKEKTVDFTKTLLKMREQRINLVHNVNQYVFAHFVVLECLFGTDFSIPINDSFQDEVIKMLRKITVKPLMMELDKVMMQFKKRQLCFTTNMSDDDKNKNRFSDILPGHAQIFLPPSSEYPSNYINAVIVDCYRCPRKFIVTQQPLPNTVEDFWSLVKEYEVNTIVSLNEIDGKDPNCPKFWTHSSKTQLQILEEIEDRTYDITKVKICDESDSSTEKTVNVIRMKKWQKETSYTSNPKDLILVWKKTFDSSWKGNSQIIVTCYDGATASGLFVALAYLIEKINYEQTCDVFSAIRTVRQSREEFVQEWGQMEFLYKAAKVYIEEFEDYDNFD